jgi:hypothetical protein
MVCDSRYLATALRHATGQGSVVSVHVKKPYSPLNALIDRHIDRYLELWRRGRGFNFKALGFLGVDRNDPRLWHGPVVRFDWGAPPPPERN